MAAVRHFGFVGHVLGSPTMTTIVTPNLVKIDAVAQLVKCLVNSGYPDGSSSGGPERAAVAEHDCPEINSSQRWCLCKKNTHVVWSHGDLGSSRSSISS